MNKDSIIILAWPQTPAKSIGMWYDNFLESLGFLKDGYYKAGHAAAILVNHKNRDLKYFDFGRYHMPQKYGRVRDEQTDPRLKIKTKAIFLNNIKILNIRKILQEVNANKECHGSGILYASILEDVSFENAYDYAKKLQNEDAVSYGPYDYSGSNCSRFIASLALAGKPKISVKLKLSLPLLFTPMPKGNVIACNSVYYSVLKDVVKLHTSNFYDALKNFIFPSLSLKRKIYFKNEFVGDMNKNNLHKIKIHAN